MIKKFLVIIFPYKDEKTSTYYQVSLLEGAGNKNNVLSLIDSYDIFCVYTHGNELGSGMCLSTNWYTPCPVPIPDCPGCGCHMCETENDVLYLYYISMKLKRTITAPFIGLCIC